MALRSRLFHGDDRLEACAISDPAHLTPGSSGRSVGKVQRALTITDGAVIEAREMRAETYGPSTTAAVLSYKQARNIINKAYEQTVDPIVGKMTIKSLDDEMSRIEANAKGSAICGDPGPAGDAGRRFQIKRTEAFGTTSNQTEQVGFSGRVTTQLNLSFQITTEGEKVGGRRLVDQVAAANELTQEMLIIDTPSLRDVKAFEFTMLVRATDDAELQALRKKAGEALQLGSHKLRVIVHRFVPNSDEFGLTKTIFLDGTRVAPFIVLNANKSREDHMTLLHEMIHAAGIIGPHDSEASEPGTFDDDTSVFSYGGPKRKDRDHIRGVHLDAIRRAPWSTPFEF